MVGRRLRLTRPFALRLAPIRVLQRYGRGSTADLSSVRKENVVGIVVALVVLALLFGVLGAVVEGLLWLLFIGLVLLAVGAVMGFSKRGTSRA